MVSVQGDSSYLRKWAFEDWGLSWKLPLVDLLEPRLDDLPLEDDAPLFWPREREGRSRSGLDDEDDSLSRREDEDL